MSVEVFITETEPVEGTLRPQKASHSHHVGVHAVCRQRQGLSWSPEEPKGLSANLSHLVTVATIDNFKPQPEDALPQAYGSGACPALVMRVASPLLALRKKAIEQILDMCSGPRNISGMLASGIVPAINQVALEDPDDEMRAHAVAIMCRLAREKTGRDELVGQDSLKVLRTVAADAYKEVRARSLQTVYELAVTPDCSRELFAHGFVKLLIDRMSGTPTGGKPHPEIQAAALTALKRLLIVEESGNEAVELGAVTVIIDLLSSKDGQVRIQAAYALSKLLTPQEQKSAALSAGIMARLVVMLGLDRSVEEQTAAACALMTMANGTSSASGENQSKLTALNSGAVKALANLLQQGLKLEMQKKLNHKTSSLTVYVCQCMVELAESPKGRKQLHASLVELEALAASDEPLVKKHATIAIETIRWKP